MNKEKLKKRYTKTKNFFQQKKVINIIVIILFLAILILSTSIRLQNLPLLIDQTTGEYLPLALDPYYFLRVAETMVEQGENIPAIDSMRYPLLDIPFTKELTPRAVVFLHKISNLFGDYNIQYIDILFPVIFFVLGLIVFFVLIYALTNSKGIALLSSGFLAFIPPYLYRTMAGFSDHESLGMFAFFSVMLVYTFAIKSLEKDNINILKTIFFSVMLAGLTIFALLSWGGVAAFILMLLPFSFLLIWIIKFKKENQTNLLQYSLFYILWVISTFVFGFMFGYPFSAILGMFMSSSGIIGAFVFGFVIVDSILYYLRSKNHLKKLKEHRVIWSALGTIGLGVLLLTFSGRNVIQIVINILTVLLQPFGTERIALTVAENAQPFLVDWMGQIGKLLFWISFAGIIIIGLELGRKISSKKGQRSFIIIWTLLISGILFSKYAPTSILNGETFISNGFYIIGIIIFAIYGIKIYFKNEIELNSTLILLCSLMFVLVISIRSASRIFFLVVPFACLSASFLIFKIKDYLKESKDELVKWILTALFILVIIFSFQILYTSYNNIDSQSKFTGPSANAQWQQAMSWVRNNTPQDSIFVHWWDYGYWVQYLGERPTITDGGHGNAFWDHLIGRYLLTTQNPKSALGFMKAQEVDYLLIDQTDLGKYPAYSKIAGDGNFDSFSVIQTGVVDHRQTTESRDFISRVYNLGGIVDEDIVYENKFLPGPGYNEIGEVNFYSYIGAITISLTNQTFNQPIGIFLYNNEQIKIPLRYIYFQGQIIDFGTGLDSVAYIFPQITQSSIGVNVDLNGAVIYLSPKVSKSLFAQLYLLNNVFNNYPTITLAHSELDPLSKNLQSQGANIGEFIYFNGFRGPIKIFEIDYPSDTIAYEEFTRKKGEYAEFDYLFKNEI